MPGARLSWKTRSAFITASPDASGGPSICGVDPYTGQDYSHRKEWILDRLRELAGLHAAGLDTFPQHDEACCVRRRTRNDRRSLPTAHRTDQMRRTTERVLDMIDSRVEAKSAVPSGI